MIRSLWYKPDELKKKPCDINNTFESHFAGRSVPNKKKKKTLKAEISGDYIHKNDINMTHMYIRFVLYIFI
jgi:hypothetical protein